MFSVIILVVLAFASNCESANLSSRSVTRGSETGMVNLIEFNIKGTVYGKCTFRHQGEEVSVTYEETGDVLNVKVNNPTIVDRVAKTRMCRELATRVPDTAPESRSALGEITPETEEELLLRIQRFQAELASNQHYMNSDLKPKFLNLAFLTSILQSTNLDNYGVTLGHSGSNFFPGLNLGFTNSKFPFFFGRKL